jgi:ubiquinone/menaquinone biosynthesis C-methylase UbiE
VLLLAARLLPSGRSVGVDLWKTSDQSGNRREVTLRNADLEGVRDRVEIHTADMRCLPFEAESFDLVVSSLAIHNITTREGRGEAIDEAVRVLRPGGRILIADMRTTGEYADRLLRRGMVSVRRSGLGWRFWYGGPWAATSLVTATKPG